MAIEALIRVVDALERLALPYMVVGAFSSSVWGRGRMTKDADLVVEITRAASRTWKT